VSQHGGWEVINLPAIAQEEEKFNYLTWREQATHVRKAGQVLQPKREPLEVLEMLRKQMGSYEFAGQYLQQPIPEDGGIVKLSWLHRYSPEQKLQKFDQIVHSWDTASKATELSDYSVCTVWGLANKRIYLIDVIRERLEFPNLKRKVIELYRRDNPKTILIEDQASGIQLIQELKEQSIYCVKAVKTQTDKVMRLKGQTARIENGEVLFPNEATWLDTYIAEMTVFPNGRNDDQVDSTSQALEWINTPTPNSGLLEYYRQEAEKLKRGQNDHTC
jgi:predicted phage terminase large subunit-like protein